MAQFRIEFVLDQASGRYIAELYHPDDATRLLVRTRAVYRDPGAALLGVVSLFKGALGRKAAPKKAKAKRKKSKRRKA